MLGKLLAVLYLHGLQHDKHSETLTQFCTVLAELQKSAAAQFSDAVWAAVKPGLQDGCHGAEWMLGLHWRDLYRDAAERIEAVTKRPFPR